MVNQFEVFITEGRFFCYMFPEDENRETEVSAASVSLFWGGRFCEKIIGEMLGFLDYFL